MADISKIRINNVNYDIKDAKCRAELEALIGSDTLAGDVDTIKEIQAFLANIDTDDPTLFNQLKAINDRIDAIEAVSGTVDDALSGTSTNPVQNKVIKGALDSIGSNINTLSGVVVHTISVNGGSSVAPTNGNVDIAIPSAAWADVKPSGGVPKSDLATGVQTSLGKADSAIQGVKVNGTELTPDSTKKVDVTVPTKLSDLTADATHRLVTDTEKNTWNNKQNALTFDNTPTKSSANPVKSGGVYSALADLYDGYDSTTETLSFTFPTE